MADKETSMHIIIYEYLHAHSVNYFKPADYKKTILILKNKFLVCQLVRDWIGLKKEYIIMQIQPLKKWKWCMVF